MIIRTLLTLLFRFRFKFRHSLVRILLLNHLFFIASSAQSDSEFLLRFKFSLQNSTSLDATWNSSEMPCSGQTPNWEGLRCNKEGQVYALKLENMSLRGPIDVLALANLKQLRSLSLMHNNFEGPLPDLGQLGTLKSLFLSGNNFSGTMDSAVFLRTMSLKKLHLAHNHLGGQIPVSLALLPKLIALRLEGNRFEGSIPSFSDRTWLSFNVSYNLLRDSIPASLKAINASSFYGNKGLCGEPLGKCTATKSSIVSVVVVGIVVMMALSAIVAVIVIVFRFTRSPAISGESQPEVEVSSSSLETLSRMEVDNNQRPRKSTGEAKLWFVREEGEHFGIQELLGAKAEMLGSGRLGSTYKVDLKEGGPVVVVKRFKHMNNVNRDEFQDHMKRLGALRHPNVLPVIAYFYKRDEKLLISEYVGNYSLAYLLHRPGIETSGRLDGATRVNIVKGVARGLKYLQDELPGVMAAHGNLKTSNVLLKEQSYEAVVCDYSLAPLMNQEHAERHMAAYKCPEYSQHGRITRKTDVWCLGMLILEILTGKWDDDLPAWVASKSMESLDDVFQPELLARSDVNTLVAIRKLLKIGLECCEPDVEARPDIRLTLHKIENCDRPYSKPGVSDYAGTVSEITLADL